VLQGTEKRYRELLVELACAHDASERAERAVEALQARVSTAHAHACAHAYRASVWPL
jgi:hypothetical protein